MIMCEAKYEKHEFAKDVKLFGLPVAQQRQRKRQIFRDALVHSPKVCRKCRTTLFCKVCSQGGWLYD